MTDEVKTDKKPQKPIERVTVSEELKAKLANLTSQANEALQGIASVTKSDVVNLIIHEHPGELDAWEIDRLKSTHIDEVKFSAWIAQEMKNAKRAGETVTFKELLERCEIALAGKQPRAKPRTKKRKDVDVADGASPLVSGEESSEAHDPSV